MNDMSSVIAPRSDQINADTLLAGPLTFTIKEVHISGGQEQPVSIALEGTPLFFRPCKSMSRVLVAGWGPDAKAYIGRSLTLYRDASVKWGGLEVGGIRISHMSDIGEAKTLMLTATKGSRKPHKVLPLIIAKTKELDPANPSEKWVGGYIANLTMFETMPELDAFVSEKAVKLAELQEKRPDLYDMVSEAISERVVDLAEPAKEPVG